MDATNRFSSETRKLVEKKNEFSIEVIEDFSATAATKIFEQEIREVVILINYIRILFLMMDKTWLLNRICINV